MNTGSWTRAMTTECISRCIRICAGLIAGAATFLAGRPAPAQIVQCSPGVDTVYFVSGCTPPEVVFSLENRNNLSDSLTIKPGFNTSIGFSDSIEMSGAPAFVSLLINDSSHALAYKLDLRGISRADLYSIAPDSTCQVTPAVFRMVFSIFRDGAATDSVDWTAIVKQVPVRIHAQDNWGAPKLAVISAYPNPFNPTTTIHYAVPERQKVSLKIYDLVGREVLTLLEATQDAGEYEVTFDGSRLSSGVYFVRQSYDGRMVTCKLVLMK